MIGIIGATIQEAEAVKKEMTDIIEETVAGMTFFKGKFCDKDIVFVQSGICKVNAAMTATTLLYRYDIDTVIFSGVAGSLDKKIKVGDVVIGTDIVHHDVDATEFGYRMGQIPQMKVWSFESNPRLLEKAKNIKNDKFKTFFGRILTGEQFIGEKERKIELGKEFEALCVDMESAAVAQVCYRLDKDFLIIRSISDTPSDEAGMEYNTFVELAANNSKEILKEILK